MKPRIRIRPRKTGVPKISGPRINKGGMTSRKMKGLPKPRTP
jgi:hypothetical protein